MKKNRLYAFLGLGCAIGYGWIFFSMNDAATGFSSCFFKSITGFACPSCGSTRSIKHFIAGDLQAALLTNPLGIVTGLALIAIPFWLLYDVLLKKDSLFIFYNKLEKLVAIKWVAIFLIAIVVANWIWNINKNL